MLLMMWMKPKDQRFQQAQPAEYSTCHHKLRYRLRKAYGFVIRFKESWVIKTSTCFQEVKQLWQTEAIFQQNKHEAHPVLQQFRILFSVLTFSFPISVPAISGQALNQ